MPNALVTGHLGFVGRHLCSFLRANSYQVSGLDLKDGQDVRDCELPHADRVFHLAAQTNAQSDDAETDALTNVIGSIRIFSRYREKAVFASSSMVHYPTSPYAISKRSAEDYARYYGAAIVRFCNLYGPGGHSVIDKFRDAERMTIYGSGDQVRTYAPISGAIRLLMSASPRQTSILPGEDLTVNQIAEQFPNKPIDRVQAKPLDVLDGRQQPVGG